MTSPAHERIRRNAMRLARLAAFDAPAIILADVGDRLDSLISERCAETGVDRNAWRKERAAARAAEADAATELTVEEEAELDAEEAAYAAAEKRAQAKSGHPDALWELLDTDYRFNLIMAEYEEPKA